MASTSRNATTSFNESNHYWYRHCPVIAVTLSTDITFSSADYLDISYLGLISLCSTFFCQGLVSRINERITVQITIPLEQKLPQNRWAISSGSRSYRRIFRDLFRGSTPRGRITRSSAYGRLSEIVVVVPTTTIAILKQQLEIEHTIFWERSVFG